MSPISLVILSWLISIVDSGNIAFFCNTGAYSHDIYTSHLAQNMIAYTSHNVSINQISIFKFNRQVQFSEKFEYFISHDFTNDTESQKAQELSQQLMWEVLLPYDFENGTLIGINAMQGIQDSFMRGCISALDNQTFMNQIRNLNLDLMVVDYVMNDCAIGIANYLNIPTIYTSNVPLYSNYLDYTGVPSNPSYVPTFLSNFEPYADFFDRLLNIFSYTNLVVFRRLWYHKTSNIFFEKLQLQLPHLSDLERRTLMVSTPWEMFLDMPRPLARNFRYFGCEHCMDPPDIKDQGLVPPSIPFRSKTIEKPAGIILVSFGTLVKAQDIPVETLQEFVNAFRQLRNYLFLWQLDMSRDHFTTNVLKPGNLKMPGNVHLYRWLPMRQLMQDPKVLLVVTHGGITTSLEAAYNGMPMLGIAIHSDQYHNTQRIEQRGLGHSMQVVGIDWESISDELNRILNNHKQYKKRAMKFRDMLIEYRDFDKFASAVWIDFLTRHFGGPSSENRRKLQNFWILNYPSNWFVYFSADIMCLAFILCCVLVVITLIT